MSAAPHFERISVDEYLAGELDSPVKHEYLGGVVYAMARGRNVHNLIASNALVALGRRLQRSGCKPYNSDTKIRIRLPTQVRFYYPDASVICRSNPPGDSFQDEPAIIVEVVSRRTRRIDEGEKREAYVTIPSLIAYLIVEQDRPGVTVHRRTERGFTPEIYSGLSTVIPLAEIAADLPLADVYDGVEFGPEAEDHE